MYLKTDKISPLDKKLCVALNFRLYSAKIIASEQACVCVCVCMRERKRENTKIGMIDYDCKLWVQWMLCFSTLPPNIEMFITTATRVTIADICQLSLLWCFNLAEQGSFT